VYERHDEPLLPWGQFLVRFARHGGVACLIVLASLGAGVVGFHEFAGELWIDSFLNASMLLGGMGLVGDIQRPAGKIFASLYALYAGLVFIVVAGVLLAPIVHRFLHKMHAAERRSKPGRKN